MAGENSLVFQIGADLADLQRKLSEAKGHLKSFADEGAAPVEASLQQIGRSFEQLGSKLTSIGTTLSVAITAPLVGVGVAAVNVAGEFGAAMNRVKANLDDVTENGIKQLDLLAQQLGAKTKFSALEAAQGMGEFAAAGFKTQEIMAVMPATLDLAAAAQTSVAEASRVTKDILGQFGLSAKDAQNAIDVLAKAGTMSSGSLMDMANSLTYVGPVAKSLGMNIVDTTAALIELDKAGLRNEKSGRALRDMLGDLVAPTTKAQEVMTSLGISVRDAAGNLLPFPQVMENFKAGLDKTHGSADRLAALTTIFGKESLAAAEILTSQGAPALVKYGEELNKVEGFSAKMAKTMNEGTKGALEQLRGSLETAGIALGQALEPAIVSIAKTLQNFVDNTIVPAINWFKQLPEPVQIGALALTAMAAAAGPLLIIAGQLASSIGALTALFVPAATGATAATTAFTALGGGATILATGLGAVAAVIVGFQFSGIVSSFNELREAMDSAFPAAQKAAQELEKQSIWGKEAQQPIKGLAEAWREFSASLPSMANLAGPIGALKGFMESLTSTVKTLSGSFPEMEKVGTASLKKVQDANMATAKAAADHGIELAKLQKGHRDAASAAEEQARKLDISKEASKRAAAEQKILGDALQTFGITAEGNVSKTDKMWQALRTLEQAAKDGKIPLSTLEEASRKLHEEFAKADLKTYSDKLKLVGLDAGGPGGAQEKVAALQSALALVTQEVNLGIRPMEDLKTATANYNTAVATLYPNIYTLKDAFIAMTTEVNNAKPPLDLLGTTASYTKDYLAGVAMATTDAMNAAVNAAAPTAALEVAYRNLGITSTAALQDKARIATEAYTTIVTSGTASARDIQAAYEAMRKAQEAANPNYVKLHTDGFDSILKKGIAVFSGPGSIHEKWDKFTQDAMKWTGELAKSAIEKLFQGANSWKELGVTGIGQVGSKWDEMKSGMLGSVGTLAEGLTSKLFTGQGSWKEIGLAALAQLGTAFASWGASVISQATGIADKLAGIFSSIKVPSINLGGGGGSGGTTVPTGGGGGDIGGAVAGAVSSGLAGAVSAISGVASAISSVVGNFQMAGMNKSLDVIVQHTLQTKNELTNLRADEWTRETHNMTKWDDIANFTWLKMDEHSGVTWQKLDSLINAVGGGITGGGGGTAEAALQSIEASALAINEQFSGFRPEVSTGFANLMTKADGLWGTLQAIEANTLPSTEPPVEGGNELANVELGLRNINLTSQGSADLLAAISTNIGAMRNNIGNIIGIKEAIVGQLGMIFSQIADHVVTALGAIDNKLQPVYDYYRRITNSSSAITSTTAATTAVSNATQSLASLATTVSSATQAATTSAASASNAVASSAASSAAASSAATAATTANTAAVQTLTQTVAVSNAHTEETETERRDREQREREEQDRIRRQREEDDRYRRAREEADRIARERAADERARQAREAADAARRAREAMSQSAQTASLSWLSTGSLQSLLAAARGGWLTQGTMASLGISGGFNRPGNNIEVNINGGVVDRDLVDEIGNILVARLRLAGQN